MHQGYRVNKASAILFIFLSLFGIFGLMSMVIATFETTYAIHSKKLESHRLANEAVARHLSFQCATWLSPIRIKPASAPDYYMAFYKALRKTEFFALRYTVYAR